MAIAITHLGNAVDLVGATTFDFGDFSAPEAGLLVVVAGGYRSSSGVSIVSIGGSPGTIVVNASGHDRIVLAIAAREVSSGNQNVSVTFAGSMEEAFVSVYLLTGYDSSTPVDTYFEYSVGSGLTATLDCPTDGIGIYGYGFQGNLQAASWSDATEDFDSEDPDVLTWLWSAAHKTASGAGNTETCTPSSGAARQSIIGAVWAPAADTGEVTATAALTIGAATLSGSATHTAPSFEASAALDAPAATLSGSAEFDAPVDSGTAELAAGAALLAGSAAFAAEIFQAEASLDVGAATFSGSATFEDPVFTGQNDLAAPAATLSGAAEFDAPEYTGEASLTVGAATFAGSATSIGFDGTATLTVGAATFSGSAAFTADTGVRVPGLEYALPEFRPHYAIPEQLLEYELPPGRLHYVFSEEP